MNYRNLINWKELSLLLSGSDNSIRKNSVPQKYQREVSELVEVIKNNLEENKMKDYSNIPYKKKELQRAIKSKENFLDCNPKLPDALKSGVEEEIKQIEKRIEELTNEKA